MDYVQQADSNKYYENLGKSRDGRINAELTAFSVNSNPCRGSEWSRVSGSVSAV